MIARITRQKNGIVEYLQSGKRKDSEYNRDEKDQVISLYGNLDTLDQSIKYLNNNKNYKDNYLHITLSFSKNDIKKLDELDQLQREQTLRDITETYIKHHTSGYDLENEVIAYAEVHKPKIKVNELGNERLEHIHIVISNQNALNNTRLRTTFANTFIDDTLQSYINKKYGFDNPKEHPRTEIERPNQRADLRKHYKEQLANIKSNDELLKYFEDNKINYREVKTKNNNYYKITLKDDKGKDISINLRGKDFKHLETLTTNKEYEFPHTKDTQDLKNILNSYYEKREKEISKRRSKADTEKLKTYKNNLIPSSNYEEEPSISISYKPKKIKAKIYKDVVYMLGYKTNAQKDLTTLFNTQKNIKIEDKKNKLSVNFSTCNDKAQAVNDILEIALAKGWKLEDLSVNGSDEFKKEVYKQIKQRLEQQQLLKAKELQDLARSKKAELYGVNRTNTPLQQAIKSNHDELMQNYNKERLNEIKKNVDINKVLKYAKENYKININDYEPSENNKINNKTNKQKPKSVIDFFNKEIGLSMVESIKILNNIYEEQLKEQDNKKSIKKLKEDLRNDLIKNDIINDNKYKELNLNISVCKNITDPNSSKGWEQVHLSGYKDLINVVTTYNYSNAIFKENSQRNGENVESFNPFIIYDIDNEKDKPNLSMKQAEELLNKNKINGLIVATKSHNVDKNGYIAERFRIILPLQSPIKTTDKEIYKKVQTYISDRLGLTPYTDTKALKDKARFYYKTPYSSNFERKIISNNNRLDITKLEEQAIIKHKKEMEEIKNKAIQVNNNFILNTKNEYQSEKYSNFIDYQGIIKNVDIKALINHFESKTEIYSDSENYLYCKTDSSKYSIINLQNGGNLAYDFKTEKTYNAVTYLQKNINTTNLTEINNYLKANGFGDYSSINKNLVNKTLEDNKNNFYSLDDIHKTLQDSFKIQYSSKVKVYKSQNDTIKIKVFDNEMELSKQESENLFKTIQYNNDKRELQQQPQPQIQTTKTTKDKDKKGPSIGNF